MAEMGGPWVGLRDQGWFGGNKANVQDTDASHSDTIKSGGYVEREVRAIGVSRIVQRDRSAPSRFFLKKRCAGPSISAWTLYRRRRLPHEQIWPFLLFRSLKPRPCC